MATNISLVPADVAVILEVCLSNSLYRMVDWALAVKLLSEEYHKSH